MKRLFKKKVVVGKETTTTLAAASSMPGGGGVASSSTTVASERRSTRSSEEEGGGGHRPSEFNIVSYVHYFRRVVCGPIYIYHIPCPCVCGGNGCMFKNGRIGGDY